MEKISADLVNTDFLDKMVYLLSDYGTFVTYRAAEHDGTAQELKMYFVTRQFVNSNNHLSPPQPPKVVVFTNGKLRAP